MRWYKIAPLSLAVVVAGCEHARPALFDSPPIPAVKIRAFSPGGPPAAPGPSQFAQRAASGKAAFESSTQCSRPELAIPASESMPTADYLVLSGGSLHGAFGAGFFLGLQEKGALPPEPRVVTGVSTGSLQSTFLFLARQPVPKDRSYAWVGGPATEPGNGLPALRPGQSNVEDLALAYSIRREPDILRPTPGGDVGFLLKGAKGSLDPLRTRLLALVTPETIHAVAIEACRGRKLFVGVVDVDDGFGYALDLTALALSAYDGNVTANRMTRVRNSFVQALIASSSVPVGAKPVELRIRDFERPTFEQHRNNLFIDGGARFGVFMQEVRDAQAAARADAPESQVTMVVNNSLAITPWHDSENLQQPKKGWLITTLGLRAVDILESQVYQLSVGLVEARADHLRMAFISKNGIAGGEEPDAHVYRGATCGDLHKQDDDTLHPIQFYPNYMACLIDYGRQRGQRSEWNLGN